jgi:hypothetical protein
MILLVAIISFLIGCKENIDDRLIIENKSNIDVYVSSSDEYHDTNYVYVNYNPKNDPNNLKILANSSKSFDFIVGAWDRYALNGDTVAFYFFDASLIENGNWDSIRIKYDVLTRMDYTYSDLENQDWKITFENK